MIGASINVVPIMIQRNVPGIGPWVLAAFAFAALPALRTALAAKTSDPITRCTRVLWPDTLRY